MLVICFSLVLLPNVYGGSTCCLPKQWEGTIAQTYGIVKTLPPDITESELQVHYDQINRRRAYSEKIMAHGFTAYGKVIEKYDEKIEYVIPQNGTCHRKPLTESFPTGCISDAAFTGTHYAGSASNTVRYNSYRLRENNATILVDLTSDTCEPVRHVWYGQTATQYYMVSMRYYDITSGIKDPSVFDVPPACKNAPFINGAPAHHRIPLFG